MPHISKRRLDLLEAIHDAACEAHDELDGLLDGSEHVDAQATVAALGDSLEALRDWCPECDDTGVVETVRNAYSSTCDPALVDEVPCPTCTVRRILASRRRAS